MPLNVTETLRQLVRIPSVNPMGRDVSGEEYFEHALTDHLQNVFEQLGLAWQRQQFAPRRENIVARLDGQTPPEAGGPLLMFEAHQDTVPVEGMSISPWSAEVKDGRVYGRGSCDVKGGLASMLATVSRLAEERPYDMPTIVVACSVNEEFGQAGAVELTRLWRGQTSSLIPRAPDAAIVAEPTSLDVVVAHKGVVRWRCHTHGRACHSSQPEFGLNAIYQMRHVLSALQDYAEMIVPQIGSHPLVGAATLSVGTIQGGVSVNTVPDRCTIEIDRRVLPDEDPRDVYDDVVRHVAERCAVNVEHDEPYLEVFALPDGANGDLAQQLSRAVQDRGHPGRVHGVPYGSNAASYAAAGVPTVVFGPGSIEQAHTKDEWIAIEQLEHAAEILFNFAKSWPATK